MLRNDDAIFDTLKGHGVPFVIVGGHAVNYHGHIRLTEDTDVVWRRTPESEATLFAALRQLDAKYLGNKIDPATGIEREYPVTLPYIQATHLMMLWTANGFLDLFDYNPASPAESVDAIFETSVSDGRFQFASLEWLVRMKKASARSKDLDDLANLPDPDSR